MNRIIRSLLPTVLALLSAVPASAQTSDYWPARLRTDDGADFSERLLAIHNRERAQIGEARLEWDAKLAQDAKAWANRLAATGSFEHSLRRRAREGENLWTRHGRRLFSRGHDRRTSSPSARTSSPGVFPAVARSGDWQRDRPLHPGHLADDARRSAARWRRGAAPTTSSAAITRPATSWAKLVP